MKKIIFFICLILNSFLFTSFATAKSNNELVSISIYNKEYYGTLDTSLKEKAVFTTINNADIVSITGMWKDDSFDGNCVINFSDKSYQNVTYKRGKISGTVTQVNTDGSYTEFMCKKGIPYHSIKKYSSNNKLIGIDWFYLSTPIQTLVSKSHSVEYSDLINDPFTYIDLPFSVSGIVKNIYETESSQLLKIVDSKKNVYYFKVCDFTNLKYKVSDINYLKQGQKITIYGIYEGLSTVFLNDVKTVIGYSINFDNIYDQIVDDDFINSLQISSESKIEFPVFTAIYSDSVFPRPAIEKATYKDFCEQPLYFYKNEITLKGTIVYTTNSKIFLKKEKTSEIYVINSDDLKENNIAKGNFISCTATFNGISKVPCYNVETNDFFYTLYPSLTVSTIKKDKQSS